VQEFGLHLSLTVRFFGIIRADVADRSTDFWLAAWIRRISNRATDRRRSSTMMSGRITSGSWGERSADAANLNHRFGLGRSRVTPSDD